MTPHEVNAFLARQRRDARIAMWVCMGLIVLVMVVV